MTGPGAEPAAPTDVREATPPDPPHFPINVPQSISPYYPPPAYPPPGLGRSAPVDGRAITSLAASILGILLGLPFGLPGLALGPFGYFTGRAALATIDSSAGAVGGRSLAVTGWVLGAVATAIGAVVSFVWLVLLLIAISATPTFQ